jgi:hypothetical protein
MNSNLIGQRDNESVVYESSGDPQSEDDERSLQQCARLEHVKEVRSFVPLHPLLLLCVFYL